MDQNTACRPVPDSISFGFKVLEMPSLDEFGIPLSGYFRAALDNRLQGQGSEECWINRGDPLLTYFFLYFRNEKKGFFSIFNDPVECEKFNLVSPIAGLLVSMRKEKTLGVSMHGIGYPECEERLLPVILVPNDEPTPDGANFHVYDQLARHMAWHFGAIPIRDEGMTFPKRLSNFIDRNNYLTETLHALQRRDATKFRQYKIREITADDTDIIRIIQHLRTKSINLRDKLVHIARRFGESA